MKEIYLDNSATTPISGEALEVYVKASQENWGNPSSRHSVGKRAEDAIQGVRAIIRTSIGARDGAVVFTSGGTESNNLAILGRALSKPRFLKGGKILTTAGEHASVTRPLGYLADKGFRVVEIPTVGGVLDEDALLRELTPDVVLFTMTHVNNETGAVYSPAYVSRLLKKNCPDGVLHVDATQAYLKMPLNVREMGADLVTLSSHKVRGPKGVGALWINPDMLKTRGISAQILGGGQEGDLRSGTQNVPGILAFGEAVRQGYASLQAHRHTLASLRDTLVQGLAERESLREVKPLLTDKAAPHILSLTMPSIKSEVMLHFLASRGIYVSSGSACSSHDSHTSTAMLAWGLSEKEADCTLRVSFGVQNTEEDVTALLDALEAGLASLVRRR